MANDPISGLPAASGAPATGDLFPGVDISDTSEAATGTTKKYTAQQLFTAPALLDPTATSLFVNNGMVLRGAANFTGGAIDTLSSGIVNDLGRLVIGDTNSNGVVCITTSAGESAIVGLQGGVFTTAVGVQMGGTWGTVSGASNTYNVFWDVGSSRYLLENRSGFQRAFAITRLGSFTSQ